MSNFHNVISLDDWRVKVRGSSTSGTDDVECDLTSIESDRAVLKSDANVGRFAWLEVNLPDGSDVRVLGEFERRKDPLQLALEVRFKHLFPDHKIRLMRALAQG
ncbi:MAG: hypothetical protein CMH53_00925 [Myxococcales bacterium]|nr:hypothetical protein [Myxococcales bacterium]